jgi:hypothetical protein
MSRKVSIAAVCAGLLCTGLCICAYISENRPGNPPDPMFWRLAIAGVGLLAIGLRGCLGQLDGKNNRTGHKAQLAGSASLRQCAKCDRPSVLHMTEVNADTGEVTCIQLCEEHARERETE